MVVVVVMVAMVVVVLVVVAGLTITFRGGRFVSRTAYSKTSLRRSPAHLK